MPHFFSTSCNSILTTLTPNCVKKVLNVAPKILRMKNAKDFCKVLLQDQSEANDVCNLDGIFGSYSAKPWSLFYCVLSLSHRSPVGFQSPRCLLDWSHRRFDVRLPSGDEISLSTERFGLHSGSLYHWSDFLVAYPAQ